jgi:hypothetical protein
VENGGNGPSWSNVIGQYLKEYVVWNRNDSQGRRTDWRLGGCGPGPLREMVVLVEERANWLEPSGRLPHPNRVISEC